MGVLISFCSKSCKEESLLFIPLLTHSGAEAAASDLPLTQDSRHRVRAAWQTRLLFNWSEVEQ